MSAPEDECPAAEIEIPYTLESAIKVFLNRWARNWRGETPDIEAELYQLVADAVIHHLHADAV